MLCNVSPVYADALVDIKFFNNGPVFINQHRKRDFMFLSILLYWIRLLPKNSPKLNIFLAYFIINLRELPELFSAVRSPCSSHKIKKNSLFAKTFNIMFLPVYVRETKRRAWISLLQSFSFAKHSIFSPLLSFSSYSTSLIIKNEA